MPVNSIIRHPKKHRIVVLREDYLAICDHDHCEAVLLNQIEFWTAYRIDHERKERAKGGKPAKRSNGEYLYMTYGQLADDLLRLYGDTSVEKAMGSLVRRGYVLRRKNPHNTRDRTYQYTLNIDVVQRALDTLYGAETRASHGPDLSDGSSISGPALPEISKEDSVDQTTVRPAAHAAGSHWTPDLDTPSTASIAGPQLASAKGWKTDAMFEAVATHVFRMALPLDDTSGARVGKIAKWLRNLEATPYSVPEFVGWYDSAYPKLQLPRDLTKFAEVWRQWQGAEQEERATDAYLQQQEMEEDELRRTIQRQTIERARPKLASGQ